MFYAASALSRSSAARSQSSAEPGVGSGGPPGGVSTTAVSPVVLLRAGRETPEIAATVEAFVTAAEDCGAHLELIDVPNGHHGFETLDASEETRPALRRAMRSVVAHLTS
ncbi:hypothetical protein ACWEQO_24735 [Streptomyces sp. NPDC004051]